MQETVTNLTNAFRSRIDPPSWKNPRKRAVFNVAVASLSFWKKKTKILFENLHCSYVYLINVRGPQRTSALPAGFIARKVGDNWRRGADIERACSCTGVKWNFQWKVLPAPPSFSLPRVQDERSAIKSLKHALHIYRPLPSFYFFPPFLFSRFFSRLLARFRNEERNERCHDNYTECLNLADLWIRRKFRFVPRRDSLVEKFCSSSAARFCSRCFPLLACDLINRSEQLPRKCSACCEQHLSWNIKLFFFSFLFPEEKFLRF